MRLQRSTTINPKEFAWTEDQTVKVINPDDEDYMFKVHGKNYVIGAGKTVRIPGFIAWVYVYEKAVHAAELEDAWTRWNEEGFRDGYYERYVVGIDDVVEIVEEPEPDVRTFDEVPDPEPGQGVNYDSPTTPKRPGRPPKVARP